MFNTQNTQQLSWHSTNNKLNDVSLFRDIGRTRLNAWKPVNTFLNRETHHFVDSWLREQRERVFFFSQAGRTRQQRAAWKLTSVASLGFVDPDSWRGSSQEALGARLGCSFPSRIMAVGGPGQPACSVSVAFAILDRRPYINFTRTRQLKQVGPDQRRNNSPLNKINILHACFLHTKFVWTILVLVWKPQTGNLYGLNSKI